jgi:hypothetical protein
MDGARHNVAVCLVEQPVDVGGSSDNPGARFRWTKTRRVLVRSHRPAPARSWPSRRSVVSIIAMDGARLEHRSRATAQAHPQPRQTCLAQDWVQVAGCLPSEILIHAPILTLG